LRARCVGPVLTGDVLDAFFDFSFSNIGGQLCEFDGLEVTKRDWRHNFERHRVVQIALAVDQLLDHALFGRQRDLRISRELEPALADDLIVGVAHGGFDHLGHRRAAVHALEMGDRHFAGTEAVDPDATFQIVKALIYFGVELGGRYDDFVLALETFRQCFGNLHCSLLVAYTRTTLA
jgi:hypothetical protein